MLELPSLLRLFWSHHHHRSCVVLGQSPSEAWQAPCNLQCLFFKPCSVLGHLFPQAIKDPGRLT